MPNQQSILEYRDKINVVQLGLARVNPLFVGIVAGALALGLIFIVYRIRRGTGTVRVKIQRDPASERHSFALLINHSSSPPKIIDPQEFMEKAMLIGSKRRRHSATQIGSFVEFESILSGDYYIHLYGTYYKAGQIEVLPAELSKKLTVVKNKVTNIRFNLEPGTCLLKLAVFDGQDPVSDAIVWLNDDYKLAKKTNRDGEVQFQIPRSQSHVLHLNARDVTVVRRLCFTDTKAHSMTINLAKERSIADLAGGISLEDAPAKMDVISGSNADGPILESKIEIGLGQTMASGGIASQGTTGERSKGTNDLSQISVNSEKQSGSITGLNRYQPVRELGRGAMAVVYLAKDLVLERQVALKVMGEEIRQHPLALKMFLQEAKALAALNHPNVVMVFDQGQDGPNPYMVMEFIQGRTLEDFIEKESPISLSQGLELADQLCAGLAFAHARNIIHRDIKPENVFVSANGVVKIGDFGLARVLREISIQRTEIKGTPLYMAPEQIRGTDIDFRADIYALGCTLFALFTGRPPFIDGEILYHHLHTKPPRPSEFVPDIPLELDNLILHCIIKDKIKRPASAEALRKALQPIQRKVLS